MPVVGKSYILHYADSCGQRHNYTPLSNKHALGPIREENEPVYALTQELEKSVYSDSEQTLNHTEQSQPLYDEPCHNESLYETYVAY